MPADWFQPNLILAAVFALAKSLHGGRRKEVIRAAPNRIVVVGPEFNRSVPPAMLVGWIPQFQSSPVKRKIPVSQRLHSGEPRLRRAAVIQTKQFAEPSLPPDCARRSGKILPSGLNVSQPGKGRPAIGSLRLSPSPGLPAVNVIGPATPRSKPTEDHRWTSAARRQAFQRPRVGGPAGYIRNNRKHDLPVVEVAGAGRFADRDWLVVGYLKLSRIANEDDAVRIIVG